MNSPAFAAANTPRLPCSTSFTLKSWARTSLSTTATCAKSVETRYHCTVCEDFDLCVACYQNDGHPHKMEKLGFDLDGGGGEAVPTSNPQEAEARRCPQA